MTVSLMIRHPAMLHPQHAARAFLVRYGLVDSCVHGRRLRRIERRRDVLRWRCGQARAQPHQEEEGKAERTRGQPARILHHGPHLRASPPLPTTAFLRAIAFRPIRVSPTKAECANRRLIYYGLPPPLWGVCRRLTVSPGYIVRPNGGWRRSRQSESYPRRVSGEYPANLPRVSRASSIGLDCATDLPGILHSAFCPLPSLRVALGWLWCRMEVALGWP